MEKGLRKKGDLKGKLKAKKRFGQNFLKNEYYLNRIVQAMSDNRLPIVEIGPGLGDLTEKLLEKGAVTAYEIDIQLCELLREKFPTLPLKCGDVLEFWEKESLLSQPYRIVANLPYYIATRIVLKGLADPLVKELVVMVQREVGDKFLAKPGEKNYSPLAILTESVGEATKVTDVPPGAFTPPPKVVSSVLKIRKKRESFDPIFANFLKKGFRNPRKTLRKNLQPYYPHHNLDRVLERLKLPPTIRPHQVTYPTFFQLFSALK